LHLAEWLTIYDAIRNSPFHQKNGEKSTWIFRPHRYMHTHALHVYLAVVPAASN